MSCDSAMKDKCSCTYPCSRHGKCCECIRFHNAMGELPACVFSKEAERSYDRSLERLVADRKG